MQQFVQRAGRAGADCKPHRDGFMEQSRAINVNDIQPNTWKPEATTGEMQNALQGTVKEWLNGALEGSEVFLSTPTPAFRQVKQYEVKHAANFLRKAIQGAGADDDPADERGVLLWLWMNTESYCPKDLATNIVDLANHWWPCVQHRDFADSLLETGLQKLEKLAEDAEEHAFLTASARGDYGFACDDATVPPDDDNTGDDNTGESGSSSSGHCAP